MVLSRALKLCNFLDWKDIKVCYTISEVGCGPVLHGIVELDAPTVHRQFVFAVSFCI